MKPDLSLSFPPEWQGVPPAIPALDFLLWQKYRVHAASLFSRLYFNVRVGESVNIDASLPPEIQVMALATSRRRIDFVGATPDFWTLIELKYDAGAEALGQILMYRALWLADPPDSLPLRLGIVSNISNKDLEVACKLYDVEIIVV